MKGTVLLKGCLVAFRCLQCRLIRDHVSDATLYARHHLCTVSLSFVYLYCGAASWMSRFSCYPLDATGDGMLWKGTEACFDVSLLPVSLHVLTSVR